MRQIAGAFAQLEKAQLVAKLKHARDRKRASGSKVEGRKSVAEMLPEAYALAKKLRRANPLTGGRMSYRDIAAKLADAGYHARSGKPYSASVVMRLCK